MRTWMKKGEAHHVAIDRYTKTMRLIAGALLGSIAVILQSAGVFTGIGFLFSMMSTGPLVLASLLSVRIGLMTYSITAVLLMLVQPSELLVFLFTTGLLGVSLGVGLKYFQRTVWIISFAALCLTLGISLLLYVFQFPILGPSISSQFSIPVILGTFAFALLYSWMWKVISMSMIKSLTKILHKF